jgi:hypothetical protein
MKRAAFLLEHNGEQISCLLNPEQIVMRRHAGIQLASGAGQPIGGVDRREDRLHVTGGGRTELLLNLLFDVSLAGSSVFSEDVRVLTAPLWSLSENTQRTLRPPYYRYPPQVRFIWGRSWNVPGIVDSVAERLEYFDSEGRPRRSWLRLRLLRTESAAVNAAPAPPVFGTAPIYDAPLPTPTDMEQVHEVLGAGRETERLDEIATRYYGDASLWRWLARVNNISNPQELQSGMRLRIPAPPRSV